MIQANLEVLLVDKTKVQTEIDIINEFISKAQSNYSMIASVKLDLLLFLDLISPEEYSEILGLP